MARVGLNRLEFLVERLERQLQLNGSELVGVKNNCTAVVGAGSSSTLTLTAAD